MKKLTATLAITAAFTTLPASAISIKDLACGAIMCLSGDGGSACSLYENKYFSIEKFHHGHFDAGVTKRARKAFLNKCDHVNAPTITRVNNTNGRTRRPNQGISIAQLQSMLIYLNHIGYDISGLSVHDSNAVVRAFRENVQIKGFGGR